jgi:hypothetical protein
VFMLMSAIRAVDVGFLQFGFRLVHAGFRYRCQSILPRSHALTCPVTGP